MRCATVAPLRLAFAEALLYSPQPCEASAKADGSALRSYGLDASGFELRASS
jgi:hypothetical protein